MRPYPRGIWFAATILAFLFVPTSSVWTQTPPPGILLGPTLAASLRNAVAATQDQAKAVQSTAENWARRANSADYGSGNVQPDMNNLSLQFLTLRERFNWMASLGLESKKRNVSNILAELDAGLNIIQELLIFMDQQFKAGSLDRATLVRTAATLADAMGLWEQELRKSNLRSI